MREVGLPRQVFEDYWSRISTLDGVVEFTQSFTPDIVHRMLFFEAGRQRPLIVETTEGPVVNVYGEPLVRRIITQAGWELLGKPDWRKP